MSNDVTTTKTGCFTNQAASRQASYLLTGSGKAGRVSDNFDPVNGRWARSRSLPPWSNRQRQHPERLASGLTSLIGKNAYTAGVN